MASHEYDVGKREGNGLSRRQPVSQAATSNLSLRCHATWKRAAIASGENSNPQTSIIAFLSTHLLHSEEERGYRAIAGTASSTNPTL
jgi:hypothetical protein